MIACKISEGEFSRFFCYFRTDRNVVAFFWGIGCGFGCEINLFTDPRTKDRSGLNERQETGMNKLRSALKIQFCHHYNIFWRLLLLVFCGLLALKNKVTFLMCLFSCPNITRPISCLKKTLINGKPKSALPSCKFREWRKYVRTPLWRINGQVRIKLRARHCGSPFGGFFFKLLHFFSMKEFGKNVWVELNCGN